MKLSLALLLVAFFGSAVSAQTVVRFENTNAHSFSGRERSVIERIANASVAEVRKFLPDLPREVLVTVRAGRNVIPETGELGEALESRHVRWTVDPTRPEGVVVIASSQLRSTLFHECHHLVRVWVGGERIRSGSFMDAVVSEGMATAFERDFTERLPLWGQYPDGVAAWVTELLALPASEGRSYARWMYQHPDGRRWIGYRAGTYIVDKARAASGRSAAHLVLVPTDEILRMAAVK